MARLFADEDFSFRAIQALRQLGHDVLTVSDTGKANQRWPVDAVFFFAVAQDRAVLTKNRRHFFRLHREYPAHAGIVACMEDPDFAGVAKRIHEAISQSTSLVGKFIRIYQPQQK
jgi:hypothetical protein